MGYQNFFATKLSTEIGTSDTTITLDTPPTATSGRLVLEARNATQREIIEYTGVSGNDITGVTRGVGGTDAKTHIKGSLVEMNVTAEDLEEALGVPEDVETRFDEVLGDHVASGLVWTDDTGLTADMSAGVAYINGIRLAVSAVSNRAFTASVDTYIDLGDNGVLDYNEESNGAEAPAIAADHIRLAKITTDGSDITGVTLYRNPAYLEKADGWNKLPASLSVATGYNNGNRSFTLDTSADLTDVLSPGMRLKLDRSIAAPTQCIDLEASSSQYATKSSPSGITFTDDFSIEAWIKLESYSNPGYIVNRRNANTEGWSMRVNSNGTVSVESLRIASNNRAIITKQTLPLGRWVHIAATMDNSGNSHAMYIDGVSVPFTNTLTGTVTALVQGTSDLRIGAISSSSAGHFDGKIMDVRVWSDIRTATEIQDNMYHQLVGNEANLVAYFKLNGDLNDSTANANHLTGSGGAAATSQDNQFHNTEMAIITSVTSTEITVFTGTDYGIPLTTLLLPYFSTQKTPFGFPASRNKWYIENLSRDVSVLTSGNRVPGLDLSLPVGEWLVYSQAAASVTRTAGGAVNMQYGVSTSTSTITEMPSIGFDYGQASAQPFGCGIPPTKPIFLSVTATTVYYSTLVGVFTGADLQGGGFGTETHRAVAECAYL